MTYKRSGEACDSASAQNFETSGCASLRGQGSCIFFFLSIRNVDVDLPRRTPPRGSKQRSSGAQLLNDDVREPPSQRITKALRDAQGGLSPDKPRAETMLVYKACFGSYLTRTTSCKQLRLHCYYPLRYTTTTRHCIHTLKMPTQYNVRCLSRTLSGVTSRVSLDVC